MFNERKLDSIERDPDQYFKRFNSKNLNVVVVRNSIQARITQLESRKLKRFGKGETMCNRSLERAGLSIRVNLKSLKEQGIDQAPEENICQVKPVTLKNVLN